MSITRAVSARAGWGRRYPPLVMTVAALILAVFALPSALNLPQANPAQTLEYAPVPGDSNSAPPGGNLAGLGLGLGGGGTAGDSGTGAPAGPLLAPPPPPLTGVGGRPSNKECVGTPPRQTEDPMSPPCVAFYQGDNGGATYEGVDRGEIRIIFYLEGGRTAINNSHGSDTTPTNALFDLWQPARGSEDMYVEWLRVWQTYFANRFQTYDRRPHFYVYFNGGKDTVAAAQADASQNFGQVHPFAELAYGDYGNAYETFMAQHGVLNFGGGVINTTGSDPHTASFFRSFPKLVWGFNPSADLQADIFSTFVARRSRHSGSVGAATPERTANRAATVWSIRPTLPSRA